MSILANLQLLIPELVVLFTIFIGTMFGAYAKDSNYKARVVSVMLMVATALAAFMLIRQIGQPVALAFKGMMVNEPLLSIVKAIILIATAFSLITTLISSKLGRRKMFFEAPILTALSALGMLVFVTANNYLIMYLGLEFMSLPLYVLAAINRDNQASSEAGIKYFILGALASGLLLFGISLQYGSTGTIQFSNDLDATSVTLLGTFAKVFIMTALFFKISAAPFHMWAPDVYQGAPTQSVCFFATASKVASIFVMARLLEYWAVSNPAAWGQIIMFVAAISMLVGAFGAILQSDFKRLLAYSSIGHVGFMLLTMIEPNAVKYMMLLKYTVIYLSMTLAVFMIIRYLEKCASYDGSLVALAGLNRKHPLLSMALAVIMFSMAGVPPLAGFFAKLYVIMPVLALKVYWLAVLAVIASVISAYYYLRVIKIVYFDAALPEYKFDIKSNYSYYAVIMAFVLFNLLFFISPEMVFGGFEHVLLK